jgi:DNA polymerase I
VIALSELLALFALFEEVWCIDFEFIARPGERYDVVCLVAHELKSRRTLRLWRTQLGSNPPYRTDASVLFVCFVGNAELGCHLSLGWPLPARILDLSPEFRCITNGRKTPAGKGLLGALTYFGIDTIGAQRKDQMRKRIMQGWPFTAEEIIEILYYCATDVFSVAELLPKLLPFINLKIALYRGEWVAVSAAMEHRGVPIDMEIFPRLANKKTWSALRDAMVPVIDAAYGVYVKAKTGEWSSSKKLFAAYLERRGIAWPRLESGELNLRRKTFEAMAKAWPELEPLRQLRYARDKMRRIKLSVGADGRNRTVLWPFASKTSRTQPKASEWIFSPAVWLRSMIKPRPGMAVAYIDYSSMEFLAAAALSGDPLMLEFYHNDPYLDFAKRVGRAPQSATKLTHGLLRDRYKTGLLAIQYGVKAGTLATRLGVPEFEAAELLAQHHELFPIYWRWSDDWLARALDSGVMRTHYEWECRTGETEFNERSIRNWPIQANCAEILRIACIMAHRRGLRLCAPVHDAILIEAPIEDIEADVALMREIMRRASRIVLNAEPDGHLMSCAPTRRSCATRIGTWISVARSSGTR